jgi:hypothetical protein
MLELGAPEVTFRTSSSSNRSSGGMQRKFGNVALLELGPVGNYHFLLDPDTVREVVIELADASFPRRFSVPLFERLGLDRGIVYEQGARHRAQKRVCLPSFEQARSMEYFLRAIHSESAALARDWRVALAQQGTPGARRQAPAKGTFAAPPVVTLDIY